jgi:hypothetical protein
VTFAVDPVCTELIETAGGCPSTVREALRRQQPSCLAQRGVDGVIDRGGSEEVSRPEGERGLAGLEAVVVGGVQVGERELGQIGGQLAAHPAGDI